MVTISALSVIVTACNCVVMKSNGDGDGYNTNHTVLHRVSRQCFMNKGVYIPTILKVCRLKVCRLERKS